MSAPTVPQLISRLMGTLYKAKRQGADQTIIYHALAVTLGLLIKELSPQEQRDFQTEFLRYIQL